jgi:hypothetical protein
MQDTVGVGQVLQLESGSYNKTGVHASQTDNLYRETALVHFGIAIAMLKLNDHSVSQCACKDKIRTNSLRNLPEVLVIADAKEIALGGLLL